MRVAWLDPMFLVFLSRLNSDKIAFLYLATTSGLLEEHGEGHGNKKRNGRVERDKRGEEWRRKREMERTVWESKCLNLWFITCIAG